MKNITGNRLGLSLLILLAWVLIGWLVGPLLALVGEPSIDLGGIAVPKALLCAVIFLIGASALFESREIGLAAPASARSLLLSWLPVLYSVCFLLLAVLSGLPSIALASLLLVSTALGSVSQELMFRGILFAGLRSRHSVMTTTWVTSFLSGISWLPVWLWYGAWEQGIADMMLGFLLGILFSAIRVRTGSLYPCILVHALWSYCLTLLRVSEEGVFWTQLLFIAIIIPLPIYGLFLLRETALARVSNVQAA
jgi:membrane protease YdiL (CAAX protease family)